MHHLHEQTGSADPPTSKINFYILDQDNCAEEISSLHVGGVNSMKDNFVTDSYQRLLNASTPVLGRLREGVGDS